MKRFKGEVNTRHCPADIKVSASGGLSVKDNSRRLFIALLSVGLFASGVLLMFSGQTNGLVSVALLM